MSAVATNSKEEQAKSIVSNYAWGNALCSLVPVPIFDLVAITGLQIGMVAHLCKLYEVPFSKEAARSILFGLIGGINSATVALSLFRSVTKFIPIMWVSTAVVALPLCSSASTWAIGKVFIMHFEAGGTILNFNVDKMKQYFEGFYKEGVTLGQSKAEAKQSLEQSYLVVVNHEEQYSIWPLHKELPSGWTGAGKSGGKDECLAYIKEVWTDMRPLSVRKQMEQLEA